MVPAKRRIAVLLALVLCLVADRAFAQRADVPIEVERVNAPTSEALEQLHKLREAGKLASIHDIETALLNPTPEHVELPAASNTTLHPSAIATLARKSTIRVGWYYLCNKCDKWHTNLAGGYIVADGGVAVSCYHVISPKSTDMREGYLVAKDSAGTVYPVRSILAADAKMDAVVFRLEGAKDLRPLPLNDQVGPGDAAYLLSDPKGYAGYFSAGIVNRFYWAGGVVGNARSLDDARGLRINVSTDWAPGSSGAPVLDDRGNVIGHVSKIRTEIAPPSSQPERPRSADPIDEKPPTTAPAQSRGNAASPHTGTQIVLHEGIPARGVQLLVDHVNTATQTPPPTTQQAE